MEIMSKLSDRLKELMFDRGLKSEALAKELGVAGSSVRGWMNATREIGLENAVKVADYFRCSLDYLSGMSDVDCLVPPRELPPFYTALRRAMKSVGVSRYNVAKNLLADSYFTGWANGKQPELRTVCLLADYLHVSVDFLIGRSDF